MLEVKPLHTKRLWDCIEDTVASVSTWLNRDFSLMFAEAWGFKYEPRTDTTEELLGKRISTMKRGVLENLEKYHGLKSRIYDNNDTGKSLNAIQEEINNGRPVAIMINMFWLPWSTYYQTVNEMHVCIVVGCDMDHGILNCVDPTVGKYGEELPLKNFREGCVGYSTFEIISDEADSVDWRSMILNAVSHVKENDTFKNIRDFADELEGPTVDFVTEVTGYDEFESSPLLKSIRNVSRCRLTFAGVLKKVGRMSRVEELEAVSSEMEKVGEAWENVLMLLLKACILIEDAGHTLIVARITNKIRKIADHEEQIAERLLEIAATESRTEKMVILNPLGDSEFLCSEELDFWCKWNINIVSLAKKYRGKFFTNGWTDGKAVSLTFDDGPDEKNMPEMLDILADYKIKASFSIVGKRIDNLKEVVKRAYDEGHVILNHTWNHYDLTSIGKEVIEEELLSTENKLYEVINKRPALIRAPYGKMNETVAKILFDKGYKIALWSLNTFDWLEKTKDNIIANVEKNARPGDVILMHSYKGKEHTVEALPVLIEDLFKKGYEIIGIDKILGIQPYK
ncbi:MAG: polysaccharide deacetylase family protein [Clostridia bacterium]|nr:polysaccharide deacetylase family protein [Clostridia bacterium]